MLQVDELLANIQEIEPLDMGLSDLGVIDPCLPDISSQVRP